MKNNLTIFLLILSGCITSQKQAQKKIDQLIDKFPAIVQTQDSATSSVEATTPAFDESFNFDFGTDDFSLELEGLPGKRKTISKNGYKASMKKDATNVVVEITKPEVKKMVDVRVPVRIIKANTPEPRWYQKVYSFFKNAFWYFIFPFMLIIIIIIIIYLKKKLS